MSSRKKLKSFVLAQASLTCVFAHGSNHLIGVVLRGSTVKGADDLFIKRRGYVNNGEM